MQLGTFTPPLDEPVHRSLVRLLEDRQRKRDAIMAEKGELIAQCREDPNAFIENVFTQDNGQPLRQYPSHRELLEFLQGGQRVIVWGQAGWGKTTQVAGLCLWMLGKFPGLRILYACCRYTLATEQLDLLKRLMLENSLVQLVFPSLVPRLTMEGKRSMWQEDRIRLDGNETRDPSFRAMGLDKAVGGARADLIVADDPHELKTARTRAGRKKTLQTLRQAIFSRVTPDTRIWIVSNSWHKEDAVYRLADSGQFQHRTWKASQMLMPDIWTKAKLEEQKKALGTVAYARMYECEPLSSATEQIPEADIRACVQMGMPMQMDSFIRRLEDGVRGQKVWRIARDGSGNPLRYDMVTVGLDPATVNATSDDEDHDRYAIHVLAFDSERGVLRTLYCESGHLNTPDLLERMLRLEAAFEPDNGFWVEDNGQQQHLIDMARDNLSMQARCEALGLDPDLPYDMRICSHHTDGSKFDPNVGIPGIAIDFEARVWELPDSELEPDVEAFIDAACSFAFDGKHTQDELMAAWIARRAIRVNPRPTIEVI